MLANPCSPEAENESVGQPHSILKSRVFWTIMLPGIPVLSILIAVGLYLIGALGAVGAVALGANLWMSGWAVFFVLGPSFRKRNTVSQIDSSSTLPIIPPMKIAPASLPTHSFQTNFSAQGEPGGGRQVTPTVNPLETRPLSTSRTR